MIKNLLISVSVVLLLLHTNDVMSKEPKIIRIEPLKTSVKDRDDYFKFLSKFGWEKQGFDKAFPQKSFENCMNNHSVNTKKLNYRGKKGIVNAWYVSPKQTPNEKRPPLIIFNRGGFAKWGRLLAIDLFNFCRLAESGFAVLASDFRGKAKKNELENMAYDKTDLGYGDVYDSIDLFDVAEELNAVDLSRVALWGASRGTSINALMLTKLANIKAVIMLGSVSDLEDNARRDEFDKHVYPLLVSNWSGLDKSKQGEMLRGISPIHLIEQMKSKPAFLFLHGGKDKRTPAADMLEYVKALQINNHTVDLRLYSEGTHTLFKYQSDYLALAISWLKDTLDRESTKN